MKTLIPPAIHAICNNGFLLAMSVAWDFAKRGGLNQGVILTLLSFAGVFNVATFYCFFKQKVTKWQGVGIAFMIVCVFCLTIEANNKKNEVLTEEEKAKELEEDGEVLDGNQRAVLCFLAILMGMISAVLMSIKHLATKYFKGDGYSPFD